jgi:tRNA(fMet)-specific endonuclease VapC
MLFLLDTNAFSDLMRQDGATSSRLNGQPPGAEVITCAIVRGEILHGIQGLAPGRRRAEFERQAAAYFPIVPPRAVPAVAGDHYATVKLSCKRNGVALNDNDLWIAATALALNATLVTRDKDFSRVPGLTVEDWSV